MENLENQKSSDKIIVISLKNDSERERITKKSLENILSKYSLDKWVFCQNVTIEQDARGKAFPFITLSAWRDAEEGLLAQFLHEQIHWIENGKEEQKNQAIEELKAIFPNAPVGRPEGADNEKSTYWHLIICRLEFLALIELLGEEKAKNILLNRKVYTWIRRIVVEKWLDIDPIINKYFSSYI